MVAVSEDVAIATGAARSDADTRTLVLRVDGERATMLDGPARAGARRAQARRQHRARDFTNRRRARSQRTLAFTATVATELLDGANSPDGTGLLIEANGRLHEVPANRSALLDLPSPPCTSTNAHRPRVALARRDRVLVSRPDQRLYSWNGAEWTRERPSTASFDAIALDDEAMIVIPTDDEMLLRRIGESAWRGIGNGFLTARATGVAPVGSGRFVAVGQSGRLVYWNGEKLCPQSVPTDRNFEDDDFAPGTRFAFTAGENYGDQTRPVRPVLVRLTTPR